MKKTITLFGLFTCFSLVTFAQNARSFDSDFQDVRKNLVSWDAVRGEWLASSMEAMADRKPIPDRNFPEEFTPAEMFQAMPAQTQDLVRSQINRSNSNADQDSASRSKWNRINAFTSRTANCKLVMGRSYGDPHLKSFDGASYSFQTVGEFTLVKSGSGHMDVQVRQRPESNDFSLNTAVAMNVSGDRIAFYAHEKPDGNNSTPLRINGEPIYVEGENYYLEHGGTISKSGTNDYIVTWPSGERVKLDQSRTGGMGFYNVAVEIYPCNDSFDGILGNANGRSSDDFDTRNSFGRTGGWNMSVFGSTNRNDQILEKEYLAFLAKDFARQYRITPNESLFDYGYNQSTFAFTDESFPRVHRTIGDLPQEDYRRAERECQRRGFTGSELSACIYDNGFLRIPPTPKPNIPERHVGRTLEPVRTPSPNRNPGQKPFEQRYPTVQNTEPAVRDVKGTNVETTPRVVNPDKSVNGASEPVRTEPVRSTNPEVRTPRTDGTISQPVKNPSVTTEPVRGSTTQPVKNPGTVAEPVRGTVSQPVKEPVREPVRPNRTFEPEIKEPIRTTEPTKPIRTEPVIKEPVRNSEPVKPVRTEPVKTEPVRTEGIKRDSPTAPRTISTPSRETSPSTAPAKAPASPGRGR